MDSSIPLCSVCFKGTEYAASPESKARYVEKLKRKNLTKKNLLQLGFSIIDTPYSGLCSWEGVALSVLTDNPAYARNCRSYQHLCLLGVIELVQLTINEKNHKS